MSEWLTWCEAIERKLPRVTEADIARAIDWFEGVTGVEPKIMALHTKNAHLAVKVPETVELRIIGGVAGYEVWLAASEPEYVTRGPFNIQRDKAIVAAGGFFCTACLVGKPVDDQSPDSRYCQECHDYLLKEAEVIITGTDKHRPTWIPKIPKAKKRQISSAGVESLGDTIMSILDDKKISMDIIIPRAQKVTHKKRGPKQLGLPDRLIKKWAGQGLGAVAITTRLRKERGIDTSYKTIQRLLSGQRAML